MTPSTTTISKKSIDIEENSILSIPQLQNVINRITELYAEKGFFLAEVDYEIVPHEEPAQTAKSQPDREPPANRPGNGRGRHRPARVTERRETFGYARSTSSANKALSDERAPQHDSDPRVGLLQLLDQERDLPP